MIMDQFTDQEHSYIDFAEEEPFYWKWSYKMDWNFKMIFGRTLKKTLSATSVRWNLSYEKGNLQRVQKAFLA